MKAYVLTCGDDRSFWVEALTPPGPDDTLKYWSEDLNRDKAARSRIAGKWQPIVLKMSTLRGRPNTGRLKDIHGFSAFAGLGFIVSRRCKEVFEQEFPNAAIYLPVEVEGTKQQYWGFWVTEVIDALDIGGSELTRIAPSLARVGVRKYDEKKIGKAAIFRLPWLYGEPDHVTDAFVSVVKSNELTNFKFWDRTSIKGEFVGE